MSTISRQNWIHSEVKLQPQKCQKNRNKSSPTDTKSFDTKTGNLNEVELAEVWRNWKLCGPPGSVWLDNSWWQNENNDGLFYFHEEKGDFKVENEIENSFGQYQRYLGGTGYAQKSVGSLICDLSDRNGFKTDANIFDMKSVKTNADSFLVLLRSPRRIWI